MIEKRKLWLGAALAIVIGVCLAYNVLAYHSICKPFAGVTTVGALKDVWIVNSTSWNAKVQSNTNPVYNIGTIGWTWWTFRDTCDGVILDNWVKSGSVLYGASDHWDVGVDDYDSCGGSYRVWSMGTHDFKEGGSIWQPYLETDEPL